MTQKEHLQRLPEKIRQLVLETEDKERLKFLERPTFIKHSKYEKLVKKLDELLYSPKTHRVRSLLLVGNSNNGKTEMVLRYAKSKKKLDKEYEHYINPVMYIQSPNRASIHELFDAIFMKLAVPYSKSESLVERQEKIKYYFEKFEIDMLIVDEIQNGLIGSVNKQKEFMSGIKNLSNILKKPIVLVGVPKGVNLVYSNHQLKSRFVPTKIKNWEFNDDYFSLLYAIELTLPLKKPSLIYEDEKLAKEILELSDGLIGDIVTIIYLLAKYAIENGDEKIKRNILRKINYIPAWEREGTYADEI
jgi:hypothetical protein